MRRFVALALVLSAVVVVGPAGQAEACSCAVLDPAQMLEDSDAAFVGTLVQRPTEPLPGDEFTGVWVFEVQEWVKGDLGPQVGVHAALDGAACGFEMTEGDSAGVFLHNDNGRPSGGLCSTTTPQALLAADRPLIFDGAGPPVFVITSPAGRARLATLDASGRLLEAIDGEESIWAQSVCPDRERIVEASAGHLIEWDVAALETETRTPLADQQIDGVWCLDDDRVLIRSWDEASQHTELRVLEADQVLHRGLFDNLAVGRDSLAVQAQRGGVMIISLDTGEVRDLPVPAQVSALQYDLAGDRLLVAFTTHHPDGSYETRARIHEASTGEVVWESEPLADASVMGWFDADHLAATHYPIEAEEPTEFLLEVGSGSVTDADLRGSEFFPMEEGTVSTEEGVLYLATPGAAPARVGALPSPNHRLLAVLEPDADIEAAPATTTTSSTTTSASEPVAAPSELSGGARVPAAALTAAGAGVVISAVALALLRRRRAHPD